jgi:hypothetical protein
MRRSWILAFVASLSLIGTAAQAFNPTCDAEATNRRLVGAAKTSFLKKCEKDAKASASSAPAPAVTASAAAAATAKSSCETQAGEKKLKGAAKNSFVKKCVASASK